jgi:hypothetical protein
MTMQNFRRLHQFVRRPSRRALRALLRVRRLRRWEFCFKSASGFEIFDFLREKPLEILIFLIVPIFDFYQSARRRTRPEAGGAAAHLKFQAMTGSDTNASMKRRYIVLFLFQ